MDEALRFAFQSLDQKMGFITTALELAQSRMLSNCIGRLDEAKNALQSAKTPDEIKNIGIVFSDFFRRNMQKIVNLTTNKNEMSMQMEAIVQRAQAALAPDAKGQHQLTFERICRYREKTGDENRLYADPDFCRYIITKTFKKNLSDIYDFSAYASSALWLLPGPVRIASIGGGPGNDALAIHFLLKSWHGYRSALKEVRPSAPSEGKFGKGDCPPALSKRPKLDTSSVPTLQCAIDIYDLNASAWEAAAGPLVREAVRDASFRWHRLDFSQPFESLAADPQVITVSWALNEAVFRDDFWRALIARHHAAIFYVLEGDQANIEKLAQLFQDAHFVHICFERDEKPRRLCAFSAANATDAQ